MLNIDTPRWRVRLVAAGWTAAVAVVPAYIAAGATSGTDKMVPGRFLLALLGVIAAGLSGYWVGWRLFNPRTEHSWDLALYTSAFVWFLAYYLLAMILSARFYVLELLANMGQMPLENPWYVPLGFLGWTFLMLPMYGVAFGIIMTGWYTLPVALLAGYLLSRRYRRT